MNPHATQTEEPAEVRLGSVLVSLLEPTRGHEVEFHRWYERDHFYSGCMVGPHFFAGRRFVATRALKEERIPKDSSLFEDVRAGSYLALYWLLAGHHEEAERWAVDRVQSLIAHGRMTPGRRAIHAGFYQASFSVGAEPDGVPIELALDHPFGGVGLTFFDAASEQARDDLMAGLKERFLPESLPGSKIALCLGLTPMQLPADAPAYVSRPEGLDRRVLLMSFFSGEPGVAFGNWTSLIAQKIESEKLGKLRLMAPFIPTIPGTDRYADELW